MALVSTRIIISFRLIIVVTAVRSLLILVLRFILVVNDGESVAQVLLVLRRVVHVMIL